MSRLTLIFLFLLPARLFAQLPDTCWGNSEDWIRLFPPAAIRAQHVRSARQIPAGNDDGFRRDFSFDSNGRVAHYVRWGTEGIIDSDHYFYNANGQMTRLVDSTHIFRDWTVSSWLFDYNTDGTLSTVTEHEHNDTGKVLQRIELRYEAGKKLAELKRKSYINGPVDVDLLLTHTQTKRGEKITATTRNEVAQYLVSPWGLLLEARSNNGIDFFYSYDESGKTQFVKVRYHRIRLHTERENYTWGSDGLLVKNKIWGSAYTYSYEK